MFYENRRHLIDTRLDKILSALSDCILLEPSTSIQDGPCSSSGSPKRKSPRKSPTCSCFIHSTVEKNYNEKAAKTMRNSARNSTVDWHDFEGGKDQLLVSHLTNF